MEFLNYGNVILLGFLVWASIAPKISSPQYSEMFLAYMTALLFSLVATSEIMMIKPVAFFFTIGGVIAFCYTVARSSIKVTFKK